ncbi:MAG: acyl-CoA reductase [Bacteroidota bacterium]
MKLADRIESFEMLGDLLRRYHENSSDPALSRFRHAAQLANAENPWFTPEHIRLALNSLGTALSHENITRWLSGYGNRLENVSASKTVGVVMAGNIPAVGFHDFLCVLISGHKLIARLSSSDARLLPAMAAELTDAFPGWHNHITFTTGRLEGFDTIIATGSDNTSRYFNFYFGKYPNIIRKNRNSIAILNGREDADTLKKIAGDIMLYFGMGCRSVSKIFVPRGYDFSGLTRAMEKYSQFIHHNKYCNNYDYSRSIFLVNQVPFTDAGCLLLKEDPALASRIAVLHYEYFDTPEEIEKYVEENREFIQCIVSNMPVGARSVKPGMAQNPALWEYADDLDTLDFLLS